MPYKNPDHARLYRRLREASGEFSGLERARRYNIPIDRLREMLAAGCAAQNIGTCDGELQIDHNHKCCNERRKSCGKCVRGVLCRRHNTALGHIEIDPAFTAWAIASYAPLFDARNEMPSKIDWAKVLRGEQ